MKRPEYVAAVTSIYRKYTDLYLKKGKSGYRVEQADREALMDLYNRGGFSQGYYKERNGRGYDRHFPPEPMQEYLRHVCSHRKEEN